MQRGFKVTVVGALLLAIVGSGGYVYTARALDGLKDAIYYKTAKKLEHSFESTLANKQKNIAVASVVMSQFPLNKGETVALALKKYSLFGNIKFFYSAKKKFSSYKKVDTDLLFYKDRPYITMRVATPVFNKKGKFLTKLVASANLNTYAMNFDVNGYGAIAVVESDKGRYISNPFGFPTLLDTINILPKKKVSHLQRYVIDKRSDLLLHAFVLKNSGQTQRIKIIVATKLSTIDVSAVDKELQRLILIGILLFLLLMLFLYKVVMTNYSKSVNVEYEELLDEIEEKDLEIQRQADVIKFIAMNDPLTGLDNKVSLTNKLEDIIADAKINNYKVGIIFLDLDKFKKINDVYGHEVGDILLKKVAQRLQECIHRDDIVARISGDEFVVIERNMTDISNMNLVEKIMLAMKKPFYIKNKDIHITFSVGQSVLGKDGEDVTSLLKNAEIAMYISKNLGPNSYLSYDESMGKISQKKFELDINIRNALKNEEMVPFYQPKVDAMTDKVVGLEALIRWKDPQKGIISPSEFIPFCQESDLIVDIDRYMLVHSMRQVQKWQKEGIETGKVSVNISTKKLEKGNFISELKEMIFAEGFDVKYLEIEILESQIMRNPKRSIKILRDIKALGISISIDDFGTGYSSLSYLKELPVDKIKIDRSFIIDLPENKDSVSIVKTIIALAKNLNLDIIAEGVETQGQLDFLLKEGCSVIQGYYFSKPLSTEECRNYLYAQQTQGK